jgi:hypothetical protein
MSRSQVYTCPTTKYKIEFIVDHHNKTANLGNIICDYVNLKAFLMLVRLAIDKLTNENIKKISQNVLIVEYHQLLEGKTSWEINMENDYCYEVVCDIGDFLVNFGVGIGL